MLARDSLIDSSLFQFIKDTWVEVFAIVDSNKNSGILLFRDNWLHESVLAIGIFEAEMEESRVNTGPSGYQV